jgi:D-inositol-3-phosphate glycosyltransferase
MAKARNDKRIEFLGPVPATRVRDLYAEADVFAFPSRADVFGLAPVEAMASGLATVISGAPGLVADLCVTGRNSIVIDSHDPSDWAMALEQVVKDDRLREELGLAAAATIARRWTIEHSADAVVAGFRLGVLAGRAPGAASTDSRTQRRKLLKRSEAVE